MSGMALYGTCQAVVGERQITRPRGLPTTEHIQCDQPATHEVDDHSGGVGVFCDEHTRELLRDPGGHHISVRRLDQGGTG